MLDLMSVLYVYFDLSDNWSITVQAFSKRNMSQPGIEGALRIGRVVARSPADREVIGSNPIH